MEIGARIKNARINAKLTQEQVADTLCVSRQTISNWENGKTYPDIVSVVKMSDLYHISLDILLKEENSMPDYLNYLEESTNVVKSKNKFSKLLIIITYLAVWSVSLIVFWFFADGSDALGYSIMFEIILLPITIFVLSILIGKNNYWGKWKWLSVVVFGFMYMLAQYATFGAKHMASSGAIYMPHYDLIPIGALVSLAGLGLGIGMYHYKKQLDNSSN